VARAWRRLRAELALAEARPELRPVFEASLRATFAHLAHADSHRLREHLLRQLGVLSEPRGPPEEEGCKG
jgi:hypothetical protein